MRNVNTVKFDGRKAVLNSYSDHPALADKMNEQREKFAAQYPNATVRTERMSDGETIKLVAATDRNLWWDICQASLNA